MIFGNLGNCNTAPYLKYDGSYVCGFVLANNMSWFDATEQCLMMEGRLAEVQSPTDNQYLNMLFLVGISVKASVWGLFKTNFCGHFCKLFLFTKFKFSKFREKVFLNYT